MSSIAAVNALEDHYLAQPSEPRLGEAFALLLDRWKLQQRDRETALRLMFLAWFSQVEPPYLTGLGDHTGYREIIAEAFSELGGVDTQDYEVCFTVGTMAKLGPWALGKEDEWSQVGRSLLLRADRLRATGYRVGMFEGRGVYGSYFRRAHSVWAGDA